MHEVIFILFIENGRKEHKKKYVTTTTLTTEKKRKRRKSFNNIEAKNMNKMTFNECGLMERRTIQND
jgi:hypothetical protein